MHGCEVEKLQPSEDQEVDLRARGITTELAAELRERLLTFEEDWNMPGMEVYDQLDRRALGSAEPNMTRKHVSIQINIPPKRETISAGMSIPVARKGVSWSVNYLGHFAKEQGIYVLHHGGTVLYIGKTDGPTMTFGARLRREFQETASQRRHVYPKLECLKVPPDIKASFITVFDIRNLVSSSNIQLDDTQRIAILETAMVQVYEPEFQKSKR